MTERNLLPFQLLNIRPEKTFLYLHADGKEYKVHAIDAAGFMTIIPIDGGAASEKTLDANEPGFTIMRR